MAERCMCMKSQQNDGPMQLGDIWRTCQETHFTIRHLYYTAPPEGIFQVCRHNTVKSSSTLMHALFGRTLRIRRARRSQSQMTAVNLS